MRTRTAIWLVGSAVLLVAVPFGYAAWAFGGLPGLLAFVVPLALLVGLIVLVAVLVAVLARRSGRQHEHSAPRRDDDHR